MASVRDILTGGRHALLTFQSVIDIISRNISNADVEGYTRQRPVVLPLAQPSAGALLERASRERLRVLEERARGFLQNLGFLEEFSEYAVRVEDIFVEPASARTEIQRFFADVEALSTEPENPLLRQNAVASAQRLAQKLREQANFLVSLRSEVNELLPELVGRINEISRQIAKLNSEIASVEDGSGVANELADRRDTLIRELARLIPVRTVELDGGKVGIWVEGAGIFLVQGDEYFELQLVRDENLPENPVTGEGQLLYTIRWSDRRGNVVNITPLVEGGRLGGILRFRDRFVVDVLARLNTLARAFVEFLGGEWARGVGREHAKSLISAHAVSEVFVPLAQAGLPYGVSAGRFSVAVYSENGNLVSVITVEYDPAVDSLADIVRRINERGGDFVSARLTEGGRVEITASDGLAIDIFDDTGGLSVALGIDTLFVGTNVFEFSVSPDVAENPERFALSSDPSSPESGDVVQALARVGTTRVVEGLTFEEFYIALSAEVGRQVEFARSERDATNLAFESLERQIQESAGVSVDEEFARLVEFQRAFEASARIIRAVDEMLATIIGLAG